MKVMNNTLAHTVIFVAVVVLSSCKNRFRYPDPADKFRDVAIQYVTSKYGEKTKGMREVQALKREGLVITFEKAMPSVSTNKAVYWVMIGEDPVYSNGIPQKEYRKTIDVIGVSEHVLRGWAHIISRQLKEEDFRMMSKLKSKKDEVVKDPRIKQTIYRTALPDYDSGFKKGDIFARKVCAEVYAFEFQAKTSLGKNVTGVLVVIDEAGNVITKGEGVLFAD